MSTQAPEAEEPIVNPDLEQVNADDRAARFAAVIENGGKETVEPPILERPAEEVETPSEKVEEEVPQTVKGTKGESRWKELRAKEDRLEKEILPQLEQKESRIKELEELVNNGEATKKEIAELKAKSEDWFKEKESYEQKLAYWDIQETTQYKDTIERPLTEKWAVVDQIAASYKIDPDSFIKILHEKDIAKQDAALEELLGELPSSSRRRMEDALLGIQSKWAEGEAMKKHAVEAYQSVQIELKKQAETTAQKAKEEYKHAFDVVSKELINKHPLLKENPELAKEVFEAAREVDFDKMPADAKAFYAQSPSIMTKVLPALESRLAETEKKLKEAEEALQRYGKKPGPGNVTTPSQSAPTSTYETSEQRQARLAAAIPGLRM